jgi:hypothetical protein
MEDHSVPQPARIVWVAAVDAFEAADRMRAGTVEGGFILRDECISRIIKFDSKQKQPARMVGAR